MRWPESRDVCGPKLHALGFTFLAGALNFRLAFEEAIGVCDAAMADALETGYYSNLQFHRAWALLAGGQVDEAVQAVETFNPVPSGSQWAHLHDSHQPYRHGPHRWRRSGDAVLRRHRSRKP